MLFKKVKNKSSWFKKNEELTIWGRVFFWILFYKFSWNNFISFKLHRKMICASNRQALKLLYHWFLHWSDSLTLRGQQISEAEERKNTNSRTHVQIKSREWMSEYKGDVIYYFFFQTARQKFLRSFSELLVLLNLTFWAIWMWDF